MGPSAHLLSPPSRIPVYRNTFSQIWTEYLIKEMEQILAKKDQTGQHVCQKHSGAHTMPNQQGTKRRRSPVLNIHPLINYDQKQAEIAERFFFFFDLFHFCVQRNLI